MKKKWLIPTLLSTAVLTLSAFSVIYSYSAEENSDISVSAWSGEQESNCPEDYYEDCEGLSGSALASTLKSINAPKSKSYDWTRYEAADEAEDDSSSVISIYTRHNISKKNHFSSGYSWTLWNREHIYVKSAYSESSTDNFNIFACEGEINNTRNNYPFKEVEHSGGSVISKEGHDTGCYLAGGYFEPNDEAKGEVARALMYGAVTYGYTMTGMIDKIATAVKWSLEYPVSNRDIYRNNTVYTLQGNRNPFIDHPEYVCKIWGDTDEQTRSLCSQQDYVTLDITKKELEVGSTVQLNATASGEVSFSSSNEQVATVTSTGLVTALSEGEATITATCGKATATCKITAKTPLIDEVTLDVHSLALQIGDTYQLNATASGEVTFSSDDSSVASVNPTTGMIEAKAAGSVTITATCGTAKDTCEVTVEEKPIEDYVTIQEESVALNIEQQFTLHYNSSGAVTWTSSNPDIVSVDQDGKLTGIKAGNATVTATCGTASDTCQVTIKEKPAEDFVEIEESSVTLTIGETATLHVTASSTVAFSSSDPDIASVDNNGKITAVKAGSVTITATCGGASDTCQVTVKEIPTPTPTPTPSSKSGCGGSVAIASGVLSALSLMGIGLLYWRKKKYDR